MVVQSQWWCPPEEYFDVQDDWFIRFFKRGCADFEGLDDDRIEVCSVFGDWSRFHNNGNDDRVRFIFVGENNTFSTDHPAYDHADAILTFFEDTPKSIRMPLWTIYWRFDEEGLFSIPHGYQRKDRAVIVVSHDNTRVRNMICQKVLQEYRIPIDTTLPTLSHTHIIEAPPRGVAHKMDCISTYRYNICPENTYHDGYVTEKVFQALAAGCIPIYWGGMPVEPRILQQNMILDVRNGFRPNLHVSDETVWTEDALVYIYATYLKVWSTAFHKLARNGTVRRKWSVVTQRYDCRNGEECVDRLVQHWKTHRHFWSPRAVFRIPITDISYPQEEHKAIPYGVVHEWEMEDVADLVYQKYRLTFT